MATMRATAFDTGSRELRWDGPPGQEGRKPLLDRYMRRRRSRRRRRAASTTRLASTWLNAVSALLGGTSGGATPVTVDRGLWRLL